jgi:predicted nuclease of predicted toxin-antitoxin system
VFVKLLLDENLSPAAAVALVADGIDAYHVRDRGILGATDHDLLERAYQEDRVLVTSNVNDFAKLASAREMHAGIVLIERSGLLREEQIALIREIATAIVEHGAMVNELLRVADDGSMTFETSSAPPPNPTFG